MFWNISFIDDTFVCNLNKIKFSINMYFFNFLISSRIFLQECCNCRLRKYVTSMWLSCCTKHPVAYVAFPPFPLHSCSVILGRVARKTRRDASVAKLFCPRVREKFPPVPLLFRCAWESSYLLISLFLLAADPENMLLLSFCEVVV